LFRYYYYCIGRESQEVGLAVGVELVILLAGVLRDFQTESSLNGSWNYFAFEQH